MSYAVEGLGVSGLRLTCTLHNPINEGCLGKPDSVDKNRVLDFGGSLQAPDNFS